MNEYDPWEKSVGGGYDLENRRFERLVRSRQRYTVDIPGQVLITVMGFLVIVLAMVIH